MSKNTYQYESDEANGVERWVDPHGALVSMTEDAQSARWHWREEHTNAEGWFTAEAHAVAVAEGFTPQSASYRATKRWENGTEESAAFADYDALCRWLAEDPEAGISAWEGDAPVEQPSKYDRRAGLP